MTKEVATFKDVDLTKEEVLGCSFSQWYKLFKDVSPPAAILPVVPEFLQYLHDESIRLPGDSSIVPNSDNEYSDWEEDEPESEHNSGDAIDQLMFQNENFLKFKTVVEDNISQLGGAVIPKLNWSAPKDASWINPGNTTKCYNFNDILLLFKSSNHIVDDLQYPLVEVDAQDNEIAISNNEILFELVLKKWLDVNPALEFRVFIHNKKIIGISQRDLNHYIFLEDLQDKFKSLIEDFVKKELIPKFPLQKYIVDVFIPIPYNKVVLIDINPFSRKSDPLLFTWNELLTEKAVDEGDDYEFRLVNETNLGRFSKKEYSESQVPIDMIDAAQNTETMIELAREWQKLQLKQEEEAKDEA